MAPRHPSVTVGHVAAALLVDDRDVADPRRRKDVECVHARRADDADLPIFASALPLPMVLDRFESNVFAPFRRIGQRALYGWYYLNDEVL